MADEEYRYRCHYKVEFIPGGVTGEEAARNKQGAADAIVILGIVQPPGELGRQIMTSHNGFTGKDMEVDQLWRTWFVMASQLINSKDLSPLKRAVLMMTLGAGAAIPGNERVPKISTEQYDKKPPSNDPGDTN
jgi:hypothetical protein